MKYIEYLELANKENINITKLFIANEVDLLIKDYKKATNEESYEEICSIVYDNYLKIDYSSISDVANIVCNLYFQSKEINEKIIRELLENKYL